MRCKTCCLYGQGWGLVTTYDPAYYAIRANNKGLIHDIIQLEKSYEN